ncbi:MAG: 2-amino-4-hydroxy-6-hydroxymethyldihydropteridine diphosphokinase [Xanthomonadaceae bacterium]|nr:2-amino-4-hydroxy-6-hydroxymethyldihydropteridine diphosphokinase [Xanthomonadaceae bacterium]
MTGVFVALGSNLDDPEKQLDRALDALSKLPGSRLRAISPRYWSPPWGDPDQPEFLNAVASLETSLKPLELLRLMQQIEDRQGRQRAEDRRWGPRPIDLDLLLYGEQTIRQAQLEVPHARMCERAFVLKPLADLAPQVEVPGRGRVEELLADLDCSAMRRAAKPDPTTEPTR